MNEMCGKEKTQYEENVGKEKREDEEKVAKRKKLNLAEKREYQGKGL